MATKRIRQIIQKNLTINVSEINKVCRIKEFCKIHGIPEAQFWLDAAYKRALEIDGETRKTA